MAGLTSAFFECFPPKGSMPAAGYRQNVDDVIKFAYSMMAKTPARSLLVLCTDLNDEVELQCVSQSQWVMSSEWSDALGFVCPEKES